MNSDFGSSIWNLIFENKTSELQTEIVDEVSRIVKTDPRLTLHNVFLVEYEHGVEVHVELTYVGEVTPAVIKLAFEREST